MTHRFVPVAFGEHSPLRAGRRGVNDIVSVTQRQDGQASDPSVVRTPPSNCPACAEGAQRVRGVLRSVLGSCVGVSQS